MLHVWILGHDFTCHGEQAAPPLIHCWCFRRQIWQLSSLLPPAHTSWFKTKSVIPAAIYALSSHLSNLDVVPLLGGLQRLQVVTGGVVVDQFSPPFGDFFLHGGVCYMRMCLCLLLVFACSLASSSSLTLTSGNWLTYDSMLRTAWSNSFTS